MSAPTNKYHGIILFDGVCNLCSSSVQFIIKRDKHDYFRFVSLQSELGQEYIKDWKLTQDSIVLIEFGKVYVESTAALRIAGHLSGLYPLLRAGLILPKFLRDAVYKLIARNRYKWFGKQESCWVPSADLNKKFF
jgi:predicted DCC family thiol-disulfide oxidoreductase YuxK